MAPSDFIRPKEGFRFNFLGMKTNSAPDSMPPGKYPLAINVRGYSDSSLATRPGLTRQFITGAPNKWTTDLRAYVALGTDDLPRILARNADDTIWLDNGVQVGSMAGGGASLGASLIPFRPNQSPNPYMYIANGSDYQKFSAPNAANAVAQQKVGIAEPPLPPEALITPPQVSFLPNNPGYVAGGTAGPPAVGVRISDAGILSFVDPNLAITGAWQVWQVSPNVQYQRGMEIDMGVAATPTIVEDVFPPLVTPLTVAGIFYFAGTTGRCVVVTTGGTGPSGNSAGSPSPIPPGRGGGGGGGRGGGGGGGPRQPVVEAVFGADSGTRVLSTGEGSVITGRTPGMSGRRGPIGSTSSIYGPGPLPELRRGSLVTFSGGGGETCMVLSVTEGSNGALSFETITVGTHTVGESITGKPAILVLGVFGATIVSNRVSFSLANGLGFITSTTFPANFFSPGGAAFSPDDYLHVSMLVDNLLNFVEMRVMIDVGDGSFNQNYYYYTVRASDLAQALAFSQTQIAAAQIIEQRAIIDAIEGVATGNQLNTFSSAQSATGNSQWSEILFALTEFTRVGNDQTKSLQNANAIRFEFNVTGPVNAQIGSVNLSGGFQPDVGDVGAPYRYRIRGRSSVTGATSNPSPAMRYGVTARRRQVQVLIPQSSNGAGPAYDPQIDTWDVFRYGGSVTQWRYIGSIPVVSLAGAPIQFIDNFDDAFAQGGDALEFDNFEPWPTIAAPLFGIGLSAATCVGTVAEVVFVSPVPTYIGNLLPGNLILVQYATPLSAVSNAQFVMTLRTRPTLIGTSPGSSTYLFQFEESLGVVNGPVFVIEEPAVANQALPYMWGPDVNGTVFACGDPFRPGTLYFSKNNNPDSAPDNFNIEICPPTEPLLGGEIIDGLGFVWSTERCWALYFTPDNPAQRYNFVQQPFPRGLAAPFAHCNDGISLFWWAKDGIYSSSEGSLTDADLYNIFPHEGIQADNFVYNNINILPPSYAFANQFRLTHSNGYLYAIYLDGTRIHRMLVYNIKNKTWAVDQYPSEISAAYHVEQQPKSGADTGPSPTINPTLLFAGRTGSPPFTTQGVIFQQTFAVNDDGVPISCTIAVREFDGGDVRAPKQWGDLFLDLIPAANFGVVATPMSLGAPIAASTTVPKTLSNSRVRVPISVGGVVVSDFLGLLLQWTDDFPNQGGTTKIFLWQPSLDVQPTRGIAWATFGSSFGQRGYFHIPRINLAWLSTAPITLTITTIDGLDPAPIVIPSSSGAYNKQLFNLTANKGKLYNFAMSSAQPFQIFEDDTEIYVGAWGREGAYELKRTFGGEQSAQSPV